MMKAYRLDGLGDDLRGLRIHEGPVPQPGPRQVVVRMHAASLNYRDLVVARGQHPGVRPGVIPLSDGAGEVIAVGDDVYRVRVGDRVIPSFNQNWLSGPAEPDSLRGMLGGFIDGVLSQFVLLDQQGLVPLPEHLNYEEAATLPCAAVTAWSSLTCGTPLRPGQSVLVQGSGGVSIFALQLAKLFGARVIATTSSAEKAARLLELGAEAVIDYSVTTEWANEVRTLTGGRGVNRVVEVGGPSTLTQSLGCAAMGAQIALVGYVGGLGATLNPRLLMLGQISTHAVAVGSRADLQHVLAAITAAKIRPIIDRVFAFEEAKESYRHLEARNHFGKVVVAIN